MNVFYAYVPRCTEVVPRSAVVLGKPHLRTKDLGRGRCPDCAVVPLPQMFGTWIGRGDLSLCVGTCPLYVDSCSETACLSHPDPQRLLGNGGGTLQLCHWLPLLTIHQS